MATSSNDATIHVWDSFSGAESFTLKGHTGATFAASFSPDGTQLATSSVDRTIKIWTLPVAGHEIAAPLLTLLGHTATVYRAVFSPDGSRLATSSRAGSLCVYALPIKDLITSARTRLTRARTADECQQFLHRSQCPLSRRAHRLARALADQRASGPMTWIKRARQHDQ